MKDPTQKTHFYRNTLREALPFIPRVSIIHIKIIYKCLTYNYISFKLQKLWWQHIWPCLQHEMRVAEVLAAVLQPALSLVQEATTDEYETIILPTFRSVFAAPKTIQATVTLLENLHVILEKTPRDDIRSEVLPLLFNAFESTIQVQVSFLFLQFY